LLQLEALNLQCPIYSNLQRIEAPT
jgi:hypothetical protein